MSGFNRREWLQRAVLAGAGSLCTRIGSVAAGPIPDPPWKMRLSTSSIHFESLAIEQACRHIADLGYEAIDIWSAHAGCPHLDDVLQRLNGRKLSDLLASHQLKLCSFSVYRGGYARYAQLLGEAGGGLAIRGSGPPCKSNELQGRMKQFLESLKPELELAEKHNSRLAVENHGHALLDGPDSFRAFVDLNRSPRLGVALAPYHLQTRSASVEQVIATCGSQLFYFYAWQKASGVNQLPGTGPTDFAPWLKSLAKINYSGYVNPFMHGKVEPGAMSESLRQAREYLNKCYQSI